MPALGVMIVAYVDNVLTARAFAVRNGYRIDPNQELLALGVANLAVGLTQGFPVSSSGSRTVVGDALGSRTQLHSLVALASVVVALLFLAAAARQLPDRGAGRDRRLRGAPADRRRRVPAVRSRSGAASSCWRWPPPSGCSRSASSPGSWSRSACPSPTCCAGSRIRTTASSAYVDGIAGMHDIDDHPGAAWCPDSSSTATTPRCSSPTRRTSATRALAAVAVTAPTPTEWFVLNAESNVEVDLTSLDAVEELRAELDGAGSSSRWPGSSRTCWSGWRPRDWSSDRRRPDLPDPADRGRRLPGRGTRPSTGTVPTAGDRPPDV